MRAYESGASCDKNAAVAEHLLASQELYHPPDRQTRRAIYFLHKNSAVMTRHRVDRANPTD
jgi:hypothetical protein